MGGLIMDLATKYDLESRGGRVDEPESKDVLEIWSDEARAASAEARRKGGGGGGVSMPERSSLSLDEEMQKGSGVGVMGAAGAKGQPEKFKGPAAPEPSMLTAEEEAQKGGGIGTGIGAGSGASRAPSATVPPKGDLSDHPLVKSILPLLLKRLHGPKNAGQVEQVAANEYLNNSALSKAFKSPKEAGKAFRAAYEKMTPPSATVPPPKKKPKPEGATPKPEKSRLTPDEEAKKGSRPSGLR
jgi:hypothetical protein